MPSTLDRRRQTTYDDDDSGCSSRQNTHSLTGNQHTLLVARGVHGCQTARMFATARICYPNWPRLPLSLRFVCVSENPLHALFGVVGVNLENNTRSRVRVYGRSDGQTKRMRPTRRTRNIELAQHRTPAACKRTAVRARDAHARVDFPFVSFRVVRLAVCRRW